MSLAYEAELRVGVEVKHLHEAHARKIARKFCTLQRNGDLLAQRYTMHDFLRLHGVAHELIAEIIAKTEREYAAKGLIAGNIV